MFDDTHISQLFSTVLYNLVYVSHSSKIETINANFYIWLGRIDLSKERYKERSLRESIWCGRLFLKLYLENIL
jgi:hypothetical protein